MEGAYRIKNQDAAYFVTFQVVGWVDVFTRQECRDIIIDSLSFCKKEKGLEIYSYVVMSNHLHMIIRSKTGSLSNTVRDFKRHTSKSILQFISDSPKESRKEWLKIIFKYHAKYNTRSNSYQLWTHENHAIEMNTLKKLHTRINYIHMNPVKSGIVEKPEDYLYSSARNFAELDSVLEIDSF